MEITEIVDDFIDHAIEDIKNINNEEPALVKSAHKRAKYFKSYTEEDIQKAIEENNASVYSGKESDQCRKQQLIKPL